jgi:ketosteroid isomerase-like protein
MSTEANKKVALEYFAALARNDVSGMSKCMTDDATWWIAPGTSFSGLQEKEPYLRNIAAFLASAAGPLELTFGEITAEGDRVAIIAKGKLPLKNGRTYESHYSFLLQFRDGKIASGKEFLDAVHANDVLGAS